MISRFSNKEDYDYVLTQGPWLVRDNYLTVHKWVLNFILNEELIWHLTVWIRIPYLSVEYFNEGFLCLIGVKVCKVLKVDDTTAYVEPGKFARMNVEVDLSEPLLSKFRLNFRVSRIQYEGFRLICFKCCKINKEDRCQLLPPEEVDRTAQHGEGLRGITILLSL